jgi:Mce-associated membrane protein
VTAVVDEAQLPTIPDGEADAGPPIARWSARAGAFGIDVLLGSGAVASVLLVAWSTARGDWRWWVCVSAAAVVLLAIVVNRLLLPILTGWSAGRALFGITVVDRDGAPVGPWRLLARDGAHLVDTAALFVGWLWPLWDDRGRTFADLLTRTEVHRRGPGPAGARRRVAAVAGAAALVAVAAAALGYIGVYRHDLRVAQAREQIAVAGPKIVEQMLSYDPATLPEDFGRAQALVTDGYRPQLAAQQQAVRKAHPVVNAYWVTNSSVLTATENTATMLLLMQGQRGAPPDQRGITATVRVDFDRVGADWRVGNLTVLAKPKPNGDGK